MVDTKLNPFKNISLLRKNTKMRSDKRSGRKRARTKDVTNDEKDSESNPKKKTDDDLLANSVSMHDQKIPPKILNLYHHKMA